MSVKKERIIFISVSVLLLITEVIIALFVHDRFIRPYFGDVLVVILLYTAARSVIPRKIRLLSLYIFIFALLVEISQGIHLVSLIGADRSPFLSTIMGTSFSFYDIVCYACGCAVTGIYDFKLFYIDKHKKM